MPLIIQFDGFIEAKQLTKHLIKCITLLASQIMQLLVVLLELSYLITEFIISQSYHEQIFLAVDCFSSFVLEEQLCVFFFLVKGSQFSFKVRQVQFIGHVQVPTQDLLSVGGGQLCFNLVVDVHYFTLYNFVWGGFASRDGWDVSHAYVPALSLL